MKHIHTKEEWQEKYEKMHGIFIQMAPVLLDEISPLYRNVYPGFSIEPNLSLGNYPPHIEIYVSTFGPVTNDTEKIVKNKFRELTDRVNKIADERGLKRKTYDGYDGFYMNGKFLIDKDLRYITLIFK